MDDRFVVVGVVAGGVIGDECWVLVSVVVASGVGSGGKRSRSVRRGGKNGVGKGGAVCGASVSWARLIARGDRGKA